jgi:spore germination protein YaaH
VASGERTVRDVIGRALDEVDCFSYGTKSDGTLLVGRGARDAKFISDVHAAGGRALMTITGGAGSSILGQASLTTRFIDAVVDETTKQGYDGADLDWESLSSGERADFTSLCDRLAVELHARNKVLSITLIPKTRDHVPWGAADALDFRALGKIGDSFKLMTYGWSGAWSRRAGPIGPLSWDEQCVRYALSQGIDAKKILLGVPFFGYDWPQDATSKIRALTWSTAQPLLAGSSAVFDASLGESHFEYADSNGTRHVVWFQDERAIAAKAELAKKLGIAGVCCWAIGGEARDFWTELERAKK